MRFCRPVMHRLSLAKVAKIEDLLLISFLADAGIITVYDSCGNHLRDPVSANRQTNG
jgi:hypothetical protein